MHEAADIRTPLLETQLKFLAIYSSNSDEFFKTEKRVGLLKRRIAQKSLERSHDGLNFEQHYQSVREKLATLTKNVMDLWSGVLRPAALEGEGIFLRDYVELTAEQREKADTYFRTQIFPILTPLAVDPGHPFPFISNQSLSIGVLLKQPNQAEHLFARIKVPALLSRWLTYQEGASYVFMPIESLIEAHLASLFSGNGDCGAPAFPGDA